ncbi:hypothetical protein F5Y10DRAFT_25438 [Nemania abortiva]|nr:hypothetical protein F5Y10DRAFT_25438 [Nemania abortiva]
MKLTSWIESIRVPIEATLDVEQSELSDSTVEPRSVFSITSIGTSERPSMIIPRRAKPKRVSQESLRIRGVKCDAPSPDEWSAKFKEFLVEKPVEITFEQTEDLQEIAQDFLKKAGTAQHGENSHEAIEEMCDGISKWKSAMRLAVVTNQEFNADLDRCRGLYTKAVFQRTIMMSIINRSYLKNIFDFNCGGDWSLQGVHPLPSTGGPSQSPESLIPLFCHISETHIAKEGAFSFFYLKP